jgi:hypothetical protein
MSDVILLRIFGILALLGGVARIAGALIPYAEQVWLVWLYLITDALLLFGLMGVYFAYRGQIGWFGLLGFAVAELGIASIVGPDTIINGYETYQLGVAVITVGLTLFSIQLLIKRTPWLAPALWLSSTFVGIGLGVAAQIDLGFFAGGILYGLGFVAAGVSLVAPAAKSP